MAISLLKDRAPGWVTGTTSEAAFGTPDQPVGDAEAPEPEVLGPRVTYFITVVVTLSFCVMAVAWVAEADGSAAHVELAVACSLALLGLQLGFFTRRGVDLHSRTAYALLIIHAAISFLPVLVLGYAWISMQVFAAANALLVVSRRWRWWVWAAEIVMVALMSWWYGDPLLGIAYVTLATAQTSLVLFGLTILRVLVQALYDTRGELEQAMVTAERLRFARDVHDLLGSYLSTLVVKCEVLRRLPDDANERAARELEEVATLSRTALAEARSVVTGDADGTLCEEIEAARSVLTGAGIRLEHRSDSERSALPVMLDHTFATVAREAVTNVLRHADATLCRIEIEERDHRVVLSVTNDGARASDGTAGSGLDNLARRMRRIGGTLTTRRAGPDDTFRLIAEAPIDDVDHEQRPWHPRTVIGLLGRADATSSLTDAQRLSTANLPPYLLAATLVGYVGIALLWIVGEVHTLGLQVLSVVSLGIVTGGVAALSLRTLSQSRRWIVLVVVSLSYVAVPWATANPQLGAPGLLAGALLLVIRPPWVAAGAAALFVLALGALHLHAGSPALNVVYAPVSAGMSGLVIYGVVKMSAATAAARGRSATLATNAVALERLGFEHDLNVVLGRTLSQFLTLAEDGAARTGRPARPRHDEVSRMIDVAREGLAEIRAMGVSYRLRASPRPQPDGPRRPDFER